MEALRSINVAVRFLLELCMLAIFSYWGFRTGDRTLTKMLLGIGSPILFAAIWGLFLAPKSAHRLPDPWLLLLELVLFALATLALYDTGQVALTVAFGAIYLLNKILMIVWRQ